MRSMEKGVSERNPWCELDGRDHDLTKSLLMNAQSVYHLYFRCFLSME